VQAWGPLGRGRKNDDPELLALGKKYQKTPAQIAIKWILQHGVVPLPGSKNPQHIKENLQVDFTLSDEDMRKMDDRAKKGERHRYSFDEFGYTYEQCWPKKR
jgi:diketogulonate reductase-like aldo/keto reductase